MKTSFAHVLFFAVGIYAGRAGDLPEPKFRPVTIDDKIGIGYGLAIADVDGDGKDDILLVDKQQIVWYKNPTWEKFVIAENLTRRDNVCIAAGNIGEGGKCEIAVGADWDPSDTENSGAVFYLARPADPTQRWEPVRLPAEVTTHRMYWYFDSGRKGWDLVVIPLHGKGNKNGAGAGVRILAYEKPDDVRAPWRTKVISDGMHKTHGGDIVSTADNIGDGFLIAGAEGIHLFRPAWDKAEGLLWREANPGSGGASLGPEGAGDIRHGKLGEKPLIAAVEPMHGNMLAAYVGSPVEDQRSWQRHVLTDKLVEGHAVQCGDFLKVGSDQIVVGWRGNPAHLESRGISLWTPLDADGSRWRESVIDGDMGCEALVAADLNHDGRIDLIAAGRSTKNVKIYFNEAPGK